MTNTNYYHHQKQEDATRATSSFIVTKAKNPSSPLRSTAPNSASSSPISFGNVGTNNTSTMVQTTNHEPPMDASTMLEQQNAHPESEHRYYVSSSQNNNGCSVSRGPLSPQSAPPTTSGGAVSLGTTPIPSVIHTESGVESRPSMARARTHSSTPHFPSINTGPTSASPNLVAKRSNTKVTGKKKHQISKSKSGGNVTLTQSTSNPRLNETTAAAKTNGQKKQRRLERNRLSAQLSRRRRKQYLEELEDKVVRLSLDMDSGRRKHAFQAIDRISEMRQQVLSSAEAVVREMEASDGNRSMMLNFQLENYMRLLENAGPLARTSSEELLILNSFLGQQLKSFSLPSHAKFILWLSLQGDTYYRGGRAASERLSAARIGERVSGVVVSIPLCCPMATCL